MQISWTKHEEQWAVRVAGNLGEATGRSGQTVEVVTKAGKVQEVVLGKMLAQWNGGRTAIYAKDYAQGGATLSEMVAKLSPTPAPKLPEVANGHYAIETEEGVLFYRVKTPDKGKWAGFTFLDRQSSENYIPIKNKAEKAEILELIAEDPMEAMLLYGKTLGKCGHCHTTLTSEWKDVGIGPVCAKKVGYSTPAEVAA